LGMAHRFRIARGPMSVAASAMIIAVSALLPGPAMADPTPMPNAQATTAGGPIAIADGCSYKTMRSGFGGNVQGLGHGYNFFTLTFTNNAAVAANRVVFQIDFDKAS